GARDQARQGWPLYSDPAQRRNPRPPDLQPRRALEKSPSRTAAHVRTPRWPAGFYRSSSPTDYRLGITERPWDLKARRRASAYTNVRSKTLAVEAMKWSAGSRWANRILGIPRT